jgi:hypothetical protein
MKIIGYEIKPVTNYIDRKQPERQGSFTIYETQTEIIPAKIENFVESVIIAKSAYVQQRQFLYDMFQNAIDFDATLAALIDRRVESTAGKRLQYKVNDTEVDVSQTLIDTPEFREFIKDYIRMTVFWGMGLFEFNTRKWNDLELFSYQSVPIKHIDPYAEMVRVTQFSASADDVNYKELNNVIFSGSKDSFGLLQQLTLLALRKRAAINDWSKYTALAGTNFRVVKYRGAQLDKKQREAVLNKFANNTSGAVDLPADIDVNSENQTSVSQNALFENYVKYFDEQMTKLVLGSTMTMDAGSSRSQAEVHERSTESLFDADAVMVLNMLNYDFYEIGVNMFNLPQGGRWSFVENATTKNMQQVELDLKLAQLGYLFTSEEIKAKYNL